ncbi:hypothetical protein H7U19_16665 [Hyunsoonleella sp. SJ7]|uniref:Leucine-rich repeat domain-containing protein n=1 Tax=Hyunsoonleella aquatilis TaxID=2762758 RepID=A0A923KM14_9FLAO|nr:DUF5713 family protein [Hyunsoonleella aquatilis]MBC3760042.1 hypothetical protein [Hyunsoonleella aquatilis]
MNFLKKIFKSSDENNFEGVRIEKLKPFEKRFEKSTDTVWFSDHNIEQCIRATQKLGIEHIHLQTHTLDFLKDKRLRNIKGIYIQFKIDDLSPLMVHNQLTHLRISENHNEVFDFNNFPELIFLNGIGPKKYVNFDKLTKIRHVYLRNYNKKDFSEFSNFTDLRTIEIYSLSCENLDGLSNLNKLEEIRLEKCPKLLSLYGIGESNSQLRQVFLYNCKKLQDASAIGELPNITNLLISEVHELKSLGFLTTLSKLENLYIKPLGVGVKRNDYYPLVQKLQEIGKLDQLKKWKKLDDYLDKKVDIENYQEEQLTELQSILKYLSIKDWNEKYKDGLYQYSSQNCKKAEKIISNLINELEKNQNFKENDKIELIKLSVLEFNKLNDSLDGCFIETGEREELCDIFDNIADCVGIDVQNYEDGIASEWREW